MKNSNNKKEIGIIKFFSEEDSEIIYISRSYKTSKLHREVDSLQLLVECQDGSKIRLDEESQARLKINRTVDKIHNIPITFYFEEKTRIAKEANYLTEERDIEILLKAFFSSSKQCWEIACKILINGIQRRRVIASNLV